MINRSTLLTLPRHLLLGALIVAAPFAVPAKAQTGNSMATGFATPPEATKPRCYWYWMDGRVTKEGITRDIEAMKRVGVGEAYIGIIGGQAGDPGTTGVKALTEPWWQLVEHAIREGGRVGVNIGLFNGPGWSQSGGPWVKPEQSMRHVVMNEIHLHGPQHFEGTLAAPDGALQDIATLAFPAPSGDSDSIGQHSPKISGGDATARLFDGDLSTTAPIPSEGGNHTITLEVANAFTARSLILYPTRPIRLNGELQVSDDGTQFHSVKSFSLDRHNTALNVGPEPLAPLSIAFPATTGRFFRFVFSGGDELKEINLSGAARVEDYAGKQLSKVFQDPQPPFDFYTWPGQAEPESAAFSVQTSAVKNIGAQLKGDKLTWDVPPGDWVVMRSAMASTGVHNSPAPPEAVGYEVDKMNRTALRAHFNAYIGQLLKRMPAGERTALKHVVGDSYETGPQNWTDDFAPEFQKRYGYDPTPFLPVLTGRLVGNADQSNRFLWDLRRFVADRVASEYVGGMRELCHEQGLKMWLENYGHWGFPGEFLQYGGQSDEIGGEFWATGNLGSIELRDASSASHIYGQPVTYAEAWTGGPLFTSTPWSLKRRGDWAFCQGINQFVLHVNISQPDDRRPGISAGFGTEFNRNNTWFGESKSWIDYLRRCHFMLQQGKYVADVAYFIGEDAPKMTGSEQPDLPSGYSFDYINADAIENRMTVKDGRFVLPDGMSYRLIVLSNGASLRPPLLKKLRDMVAQGGAVMGEPPTKSPSLQNYPACDTELSSLAAAMWAGCDGTKVTATTFGKGHVFRGATLESALTTLKTPPDLTGVDGISPGNVLFIHRRTADTDIYFLSNQSDTALSLTPSFRVTGRAPELWNPETGRTESLAVYETASGQTRVPIRLLARGSVFVVFRGKAATTPIIKVLRAGQTITDTVPVTQAQTRAALEAAGVNTFTMSLWVKPRGETVMLPEAGGGVIGMDSVRNEIIFPTQGDSFDLGPGHAGAGLSVGTNGVSVFEHSGNYFVPTLMYPTTINGWTHVAIVYNDHQPSLYLNGVLVHTGLKSNHNVHPGTPNASFRGLISSFARVPRALSASEIADQMKATTPGDSSSDTSGDAVRLTQSANGQISALAWQSGQYTLQRATGKPVSFTVPPLLPTSEIEGAWQVAFPANSGAPTTTTFDALTSWPERTEPTIKYFSGTATYSKSFDVPATALAANRRLYLDLGAVESFAEVTLNGKNLGTLWKAPFTLDVTSAAKPGANQLQVRVTNVWHNRLVGQQQNPAAFSAPGVEQPWASVMPDYRNEGLFPAGLLGPVTLQQAAVVTVR